MEATTTAEHKRGLHPHHLDWMDRETNKLRSAMNVLGRRVGSSFFGLADATRARWHCADYSQAVPSQPTFGARACLI